jgi:hypothetical protein
MALRSLPEVDRKNLANILALEIAAKCVPWRSTAVEALKLVNEPDVSRLITATEIRDEYSLNQWHKIARMRIQLQRLSLTLLAAVGLFLWTINYWKVPITGISEPPLLAVALMGVIGGCVSGVQNLGRATLEARIPLQSADSLMALTRPAIGAAAALAACFLLNLQVVQFTTKSNAALFAICFAAGFTERLVISSVEKIAGKP